MTIKKQPFRQYSVEDKTQRFETISVKLNREEALILEQMKQILQQPKTSTCLKQLALEIAPKVLLDEKLKALLKAVLNNYRRNKRLGIVDFD